MPALIRPYLATLNHEFHDSWVHGIFAFMDTHVAFVAVQPKNGTVTIPAQVRRKFGLDTPGAQVEIVVRDGEIALIPHLAVPAEDAWFWSKGHQAAEREADEELAAGRYTDFDSDDDFLAYLHQIVETGDAPSDK